MSEIGQERSGGNWKSEQHAHRDWMHTPKPDADTMMRTHIENSVTQGILRDPFPCFEDQDAFNRAPDSGDLIFAFNRPMYNNQAAHWDDRVHGQKSYILTFQQLQYLLRIEWRTCVHDYLTRLVEDNKIYYKGTTVNTNTEDFIKKLLESDEIFNMFKFNAVSTEYPSLNQHKTDPMIFTDEALICDYIKFWGACYTTLYHTTATENDSVTVWLKGDAQVRNIWPDYDKKGLELAVYIGRASKLTHCELFILPTGVLYEDALRKLKEQPRYANLSLRKMSTIGMVNIESEARKLTYRNRSNDFIDALQNRAIKITTNPDSLCRYRETLPQTSVTAKKSDQKITRMSLYQRPY